MKTLTILLLLCVVLLAGCGREEIQVDPTSFDNMHKEIIYTTLERLEDRLYGLEVEVNHMNQDYIRRPVDCGPTECSGVWSGATEIVPRTSPLIGETIRCPKVPVTDQYDGIIVAIAGNEVVIDGTHWHIDYLPYDVENCPTNENIPYACTRTTIEEGLLEHKLSDCFILTQSQDD